MTLAEYREREKPTHSWSWWRTRSQRRCSSSCWGRCGWGWRTCSRCSCGTSLNRPDIEPQDLSTPAVQCWHIFFLKIFHNHLKLKVHGAGLAELCSRCFVLVVEGEVEHWDVHLLDLWADSFRHLQLVYRQPERLIPCEQCRWWKWSKIGTCCHRGRWGWAWGFGCLPPHKPSPTAVKNPINTFLSHISNTWRISPNSVQRRTLSSWVKDKIFSLLYFLDIYSKRFLPAKGWQHRAQSPSWGRDQQSP